MMQDGQSVNPPVRWEVLTGFLQAQSKDGVRVLVPRGVDQQRRHPVAVAAGAEDVESVESSRSVEVSQKLQLGRTDEGTGDGG